MAPPNKPIIRADIGVTNPDAGVTATNPATAPEMAPSTEGLPVRNHSAATQPRIPAAVAKCVATKALAARLLAANALPALKPNQPIHSNPAPINDNTRLCGVISCSP